LIGRDEKLAAVIPQIDLSQFNPAWKRGRQLSKTGRAAILAAYDRGMKQVAVGALFHLSEAAAHFWHQRWQTGSHDEARR
jgi:hypothetical protein